MDMAVDGQIGGIVPQQIHPFGGQASSDMFKDDVVELVHQNSELVIV